MVDQQRSEALQTAVESIPDRYFTAYPGGWRDEISTALIDAVFSIRARYRAQDPNSGVIGRVRSFREKHPSALNDLKELCQVTSSGITEVMGRGKTGGVAKSDAVIDAAERFIGAGVIHASDFLVSDLDGDTKKQLSEMKQIYTAVPGLGPVTFEYFCMLLGQPGVKADLMITRFVNRALATKNLGKVDPSLTRELVVQAYKESGKGETLTHFDHALWKFQSESSRQRNTPPR